MRFKYSTLNPLQREADSLPWLPLELSRNERKIQVVGLVDSGATVNVLPYEVGLHLGAVWQSQNALIKLAGNLGGHPAVPLFVMAQFGSLAPVRLAFAWTQSDNVPVILGETNFMMEFDVCFYRSKLEFEVNPKSQ
jgi:hypothetical protein